VIDPRSFDGLPRIVESRKPFVVEAIVAELVMESFDAALYRVFMISGWVGRPTGASRPRSGASL
jgi:hypothetical protein